MSETNDIESFVAHQRKALDAYDLLVSILGHYNPIKQTIEIPAYEKGFRTPPTLTQRIEVFKYGRELN
jgi:hypothetical protein